jgi:hypothetical protein
MTSGNRHSAHDPAVSATVGIGYDLACSRQLSSRQSAMMRFARQPAILSLLFGLAKLGSVGDYETGSPAGSRAQHLAFLPERRSLVLLRGEIQTQKSMAH